MALSLADRLALGAIEAALNDARDAMDSRSALEVLTDSLAEVRARGIAPGPSGGLVLRERDAWLAQMQNARRSQGSITASRTSIDDLLAWAQRERRTEDLFERDAILDYLGDYRQRRAPAAATYSRRFVQLRSFMVWLSRRRGTPNPFDGLTTPPRYWQQETLTREEFLELLDGAGTRQHFVPGAVEHDMLVLMTILLTGMSCSELIALRWHDVDLDGRRPVVLVRSRRGGRHRNQPVPIQLSGELRRWRALRSGSHHDQVFRGPAGGRVNKAKLERVIARAAGCLTLNKHVTAQTLRHTGARWLRDAGASSTLVSEYLGETARRTGWPGVWDEELRAAAQGLADYVVHNRPLTIERHC